MLASLGRGGVTEHFLSEIVLIYLSLTNMNRALLWLYLGVQEIVEFKPHIAIDLDAIEVVRALQQEDVELATNAAMENLRHISESVDVFGYSQSPSARRGAEAASLASPVRAAVRPWLAGWWFGALCGVLRFHCRRQLFWASWVGSGAPARSTWRKTTWWFLFFFFVVVVLLAEN